MKTNLKSCRFAANAFLAIIWFLILTVAASAARINALVAYDFYDATGRCSIRTRALNRLVPVAGLVSDDIAVFDADSYRLPNEKGRLQRYQVIVIWEMPRAMYKHVCAPEQGMRELVNDDLAREIVEFVRQGGGLVVLGTKACFADKTSIMSWAGAIDVYGYRQGPLSEILPLRMDEKKLFTTTGALLDTGTISALLEGEKTKPPVAGVQVGKGRVLAMDWSPRSDGIPWNKEGVLLDRAIKWAAAFSPASLSADREQVMQERYQTAVSAPAVLPPPEWTAAEYPYMIWSIAESGYDNTNPELANRYWRSIGFNRLTYFYGSWNSKGILPCAKASAKNGLWVYVNPGITCPNIINPKLEKEYKDQEDEWRALWQDGQAVTGFKSITPFSPLVRKVACEIARDYAREYATGLTAEEKTWFKGFFLDDEQYMSMYHDYTKGLVGTYDKHANAYFKKVTGLDAPKPKFRPRGYVAPANDPWLKWVDLIRLRGWGDYGKAIGGAIREVLPGAQVSYWCGMWWGGTDIIVDEYYHGMWKEDPTQAMLKADMGFARNDDLTGERTPYWAEIFTTRSPGCEGGNKGTAFNAEQLRLNAGLAFSRGLRGLVLWEPPYLYQMAAPGDPPLDVEASRLGDFLHRYGPMLLNLRREIPPVWYLSSWQWSNTFDHYHLIAALGSEKLNLEWPWVRQQCDDVAFSALVRAHVSVAAVCEWQLMSKELFNRKAVVLPALMYCRQEVVDNLEKFIKQGGLVFMDQTCKVRIKGATMLPCRFDGWNQDVREGRRIISHGANDVTIDELDTAQRESRIREVIPVVEKEVAGRLDPEIMVRPASFAKEPFAGGAPPKFWDGIASTMRNGDTRYLFVINRDTSFERLFDVSLKNPPGVVYDLLGQKEAEVKSVDGRSVFTSQLAAGGWKIYLLAPRKLTGLKVSVCKVENKVLKLKVEIEGEGGLFKAAVPLAIEIRAVNRTATVYRSTTDGQGAIDIPLGDYLQEVKQVIITELLTGKTREMVPTI